jgi:ribosomal protein RSM22 (predicted rRNA methylase)
MLLAKPSLRVLDLGAGPGTALLGLLAFFAQRSNRPSLECVAVDRVFENLRIAEDLFNSYRSNKKLNATLKTIRADIESAEHITEDAFDLLIFSNIMNELFPFDEDRVARRIGIVQTVMALNLNPDGNCIIIEPALRETSRELLEVRDGLLEQGFYIFSPCLTSTRCPALQNQKDWCHEDIPWEPPALIKEIDRLTGLRKDSLKFSYVVFRRDSRSLPDMFGPDAFRVVSEPLITKGKIEFYLCGLQGRKLVTRLDKDRSPLNVHFEKLNRGAIVSFERLRDEGARYKVEQLTEVVIHKHLQ